jgi:hypothetical protein
MIGIHSEGMAAFVGPSMSMDKLVQKTLPLRLMTSVVNSSGATECYAYADRTSEQAAITDNIE